MYYNSNDDLYMKEMMINHQTQNSIKIIEQQELANEKRLALANAANKSSDMIKKHSSFLKESKNFLVSEAIFKLVKGSLPDTISENLLSVAKNITSNFVVEEGADNLIRQFKKKTCFLSELALIIESSYDSIKESATTTLDSDFTIKNSDLEAFYNRLEQLDYDKMTMAIRNKVGKAEEEFIQANIADRANMEELAEKTKEKIDGIKSKSQEAEDAMKQEQTRIYKESMNNMLNRKKSILEALVNKTSESIIKDDEMRAAYTLESGKINMPSIIDTAEIMYTFLEAVNTAKIKDITPEYLTKVIESI